MGWSNAGYRSDEGGWYKNAAAVAAGVTWSVTDKNANITLSSGNLKATESNAATADYAVRANNTGHSTGKFYYEITITQQNGLSWIGLGNAIGSLSSQVGIDTNSIGHAVNNSSPNIVVNSAIQGSDGQSYTTGDVMCVAVDFSNQVIWFRKNSGNWLGNPVADPATNIAGLSLTTPQTLATGPYFPMASLGSLNDAVTANFGPTYTFGKPSGFSDW